MINQKFHQDLFLLTRIFRKLKLDAEYYELNTKAVVFFNNFPDVLIYKSLALELYSICYDNVIREKVCKYWSKDKDFFLELTLKEKGRASLVDASEEVKSDKQVLLNIIPYKPKSLY